MMREVERACRYRTGMFGSGVFHNSHKNRKLAKDLLDSRKLNEQYGVERRPELVFSNTLSDRSHHIQVVGAVHRAEKKDFSADFSDYDVDIVNIPPYGDILFFTGITADGATPLVDSSLYPRSIVERASYTNSKGIRITKPDIYWRVIASAIFGGKYYDKQPLPREWEADQKQAYEDYTINFWRRGLLANLFRDSLSDDDGKNRNKFSPDYIAEEILVRMNKHLNTWYMREFGDEYTLPKYHTFPYGVAAVTVGVFPLSSIGLDMLKNTQRIDGRSFLGMAGTGDVVATEMGSSFDCKFVNEGHQVDDQDEIRVKLLEALNMQEMSTLLINAGIINNPELSKFINFISGFMRTPLLGCFPVWDEFENLFRRSIWRGTVPLALANIPGTLTYTDGAKVKHLETANNTRMWVDSNISSSFPQYEWEARKGEVAIRGGVDTNALALLSDPEMFICDLRRQYAMGGYKLIGRGDDVSYLSLRILPRYLADDYDGTGLFSRLPQSR